MSDEFDTLYQRKQAAEHEYAVALMDVDRLRQLLAEALERQEAQRRAFEVAWQAFGELADARAAFRSCPCAAGMSVSPVA